MKSTTKIGLVFSGVVLLWCALALKVLISSLPYNAMSGSRMKAAGLATILPQGWAFFTKDPRETNYFAYEARNGELVSILQPNASPENYFGFTRRTRVRGVELGGIIERIANYQWVDCPNGAAADWSTVDTIPAQKVINTAYDPTFCGVIYLEQKKAIPWAWSKSRQSISMPSKLIKLEVVCAQ